LKDGGDYGATRLYKICFLRKM